MARSKGTIEDISLCQGIRISKSIYEAKENRLLTLVVKGMVVYLLSMGSIGFYLSAFSVEYNALLCHVAIFLMALASAMLYYRLLTENLGYMVVLLLFGVLVYNFRTYINSGFYALVNITTDGAAQFFNIDIQRVYSEQIENRYVTITFAVLFIGIVLDIFLNVYISRRMQYVTAIFAIMGLNMVPLYLIFEPDAMYTAMVLGGIALAYVYRSGKHYSPQVSVKRDDIKFKEKGRRKSKKKEIAYVYDAKAMVNAGIITLAFIMLMVPVISAFKPQESFNVGYKENKYKRLTMAAVSTVLMDGLSGFFKMSEDVGGLESGKLGDVSTVRLDYQTDLLIQITPYTGERIYFKGFTGVRYNPYANSWTSIEYDKNSNDYIESPEAMSLKDAYDDGHQYSAKAIIRINNVENSVLYRPYYLYSVNDYSDPYSFGGHDGYVNMETYPRLAANNYYVEGSYYGGAAYSESDLYVPEENIEAVDEIIGQLGDPLTQEDIIQAVIDYYQENYPYTIQPGKTPYREDFVNDFLLDKKKGYCTHYASAAVLIYRRMGIPARYVEGYAVDIDQIYNAELVEDASYKDYYQGYSELGETALVKVNVTDADAHAWVEVFDMKRGWHPVEVTPYATVPEEEQEDFWNMFADMMDDSGATGDTAVENALGGNDTINKVIKNIVYGIGILVALAVLVIVSIKAGGWIKYMAIVARANINDKLIFKYQRMCRRVSKRDNEFRDKINYHQQIKYIYDKKINQNVNSAGVDEHTTRCSDEARRKVTAILEKAGFSPELISEDEYNYVINWCKEYI